MIDARVWLEDVDEPSDQVSQAADGGLASLAQHGLAAKERLLDRVDFPALGRKARGWSSGTSTFVT